jgi:hypothetical protein
MSGHTEAPTLGCMLSTAARPRPSRLTLSDRVRLSRTGWGEDPGTLVARAPLPASRQRVGWGGGARRSL